MSAAPGQVPVYRRAGANPRIVRDLAFDRLPFAVRDRLTRGLAHGAPEALLASPSGRAPLALRASLGAAVVALVALLGVGLHGLGDLYARPPFQPSSYAAVYGALLAVMLVAGGAFVALRRFQRGAPFASGRYLFSLDLVEAEGGRLRVTSLDTLRAVEARGRQVTVLFEDGHAAVFPVAKHDDPSEAAAQVEQALARARQLVYPADQAKLERLDPLHEVRISEDWATVADRGGPGRSRLGWLAAVAALAAAPAGYGLLLARNALSDDLMFAEAQTPRAGDDVRYKLRAYAAEGRRHLPDVAKLLVAPQAEGDLASGDLDALARTLRQGGPRAGEADDALFAAARRMDTLAAYNTYLEVGKRHADVVEKELLPEADFRQAVRSPFVGSLFSFVRRRPGSRHENDAWQLIRQAYRDALPAFEASEHPPPEGRRFAEALLGALLERADPRVTLKLRTTAPTAIVEADDLLGTRYGARYLPAASRFSAGALEGLRSDIHDALSAWFGKAFPGGVAEIARPSDDEGRPWFEIVCHPVVAGESRWQKPGSTEPARVTPDVGFLVEVEGQVYRDGKETTLRWQVRLADTTTGKMELKDYRGGERARGSMVEDAFNRYLEGVPARIAASFHEKL